MNISFGKSFELKICDAQAWRCCYVVVLLLVYWISECIPVAVTSLLPLILFPLSGVLKASEVATNYFKVFLSMNLFLFFFEKSFHLICKRIQQHFSSEVSHWLMQFNVSIFIVELLF